MAGKNELKVFGAGFGRTGTYTLKLALEILGQGPCHHMAEVIEHGQMDKWIAIEHPCGTQAERDAILVECLSESGFNSACDFPSAPYFKDLLRLYPNAKVILTIRDSPEQWINSVKDTIFAEKFGNGDKFTVNRFPMKQLAAMIPILPPLSRFSLMDKGFERIFLNKKVDWSHDAVVDMYNAWVEHVKQTVPKDQLLIFNVKQGWDPLCKFLNVPVPEVPLPRVNDKKAFKARIQKMNITVTVIVLAWYGALGYGIYKARKVGLFEKVAQKMISFFSV